MTKASKRDLIAAEELPGGRFPGRFSLRFKGLISLGVVVVYVGVMAVLVMAEREKMLAMVHELESVHRQEEQMVQINMLVANAIIAANESYFDPSAAGVTKQLFLALAPLDHFLARAEPQFPAISPHQKKLRVVARDLQLQPTRVTVAELRGVLHQLVFDLDRATQQLRSRKETLLGNYNRVHDKVNLETLFLVFLGVVLLGAVMTIFFTRLTWDIRRAGIRAMAVVKGYRGKPLEVTRGDEIGGLMEAINRMQSELRERERQLEMSRHQQFHQEKMAAVGSLAAAVAHEINNPIMAISGIAQAMVDLREDNPQAPGHEMDGFPELILEQANRVAAITRHIAEFSTPQSPTPQLADLNSIVRSTSNFVRFDKRFRRIQLTVDLDPSLPAVSIVADHIAQIVINLLINAADALERVEEPPAEVVVATKLVNNSLVEMTVTDNGPGMDEQTAEHAFDEFFTTKAPGKGTGLGLFICRTLAHQNKSTIFIASKPGSGAKVTLQIPVNYQETGMSA